MLPPLTRLSAPHPSTSQFLSINKFSLVTSELNSRLKPLDKKWLLRRLGMYKALLNSTSALELWQIRIELSFSLTKGRLRLQITQKLLKLMRSKWEILSLDRGILVNYNQPGHTRLALTYRKLFKTYKNQFHSWLQRDLSIHLEGSLTRIGLASDWLTNCKSRCVLKQSQGLVNRINLFLKYTLGAQAF
jgi:hypothetical protein